MYIKITDARAKFFMTNIEANIVMIDDDNFDIVFKGGKLPMKGNAKDLIKSFKEAKEKKITCFEYDMRIYCLV